MKLKHLHESLSKDSKDFLMENIKTEDNKLISEPFQTYKK